MNPPTEEECLFWLYLGAGYKDQASEILDNIRSFSCYFPIFLEEFKIESLNHTAKFSNWSNYGSIQTDCDEQQFVNMIVDKIYSANIDSDVPYYYANLEQLYNILVEQDLLKYIPNATWILILCIGKNTEFDVTLFEDHVNHLTIANLTEFLIEALDHIPASIEYRKCFVGYIRYCLSKGCSITDLNENIRSYFVEIDLTTNSCYDYFIEFYDMLDKDFAIKLDPLQMFGWVVTNYNGNRLFPLPLRNVHIFKFFIEQGLSLASVKVVKLVFRYYNYAIQNHNCDIDELMEFIREFVELGSYVNEKHVILLTTMLMDLPDGQLNTEILDNICSLGVNFESILTDSAESYEVRYFADKFFINYLLDKYKDAKPGIHYLILACEVKRFDCFDWALRQQTPEQIDHIFGDSDNDYFAEWIGLRVFDYIVDGVFKPKNIAHFLPGTMTMDVFEKVIEFGFADDIYAFVLICINFYAQESKQEIFIRALEAVPINKHANIVFELLKLCIYSNSAYKFMEATKDFIDYCLAQKIDYTRHLEKIRQHLSRCNPKCLQLDLFVKLFERFGVEELVTSLETICEQEFSRRTYRFKSETEYNPDKLLQEIDYIVDYIQTQPLDLEQIIKLLNSHDYIKGPEIKDILNRYERAGLCFENLHTKIFRHEQLRYATWSWMTNKHICQYILEGNGF
jgi:hypothetical protein